MKLAPLANQVVELAIKRGLDIPAPFDNPPEVEQHLNIFYQAFKDLNEEREANANAIPRITLSQIRVWLEWYGAWEDVELREEMKAHIHALDKVWVSIEQERRKKLNKKGAKDGKGKQLRQENARFRGRHPETTK